MRRSIPIVLALAAPGSFLAIVDCSSFEPAPAMTSTGGSPDDAATAEDATTFDAPAPAVMDAAPTSRRVRCGDMYCDSAKSEVCCAYRPEEGSRFAECIVGTPADCVGIPEAGIVVEFVSECDDPSDCGQPDLVCCHSFGKCGEKTVRRSECVHPDNCGTCSADAGSSLLACDPKLTGQCPAGQRCNSSLGQLLADGYCSP